MYQVMVDKCCATCLITCGSTGVINHLPLYVTVDTEMEEADSRSSGIGSLQDRLTLNTEILPPDTPVWAQRLNKCQVSPTDCYMYWSYKCGSFWLLLFNSSHIRIYIYTLDFWGYLYSEKRNLSKCNCFISF